MLKMIWLAVGMCITTYMIVSGAAWYWVAVCVVIDVFETAALARSAYKGRL